MDFLPGGKALKLFKGARAKLNKLLAKQAAKKAAEQVAAQLSKKAIKLAKKCKININTKAAQQLLTYLDTKVEDFISKFRAGAIRKELPGEFLNKTVEEALKPGR